MCGMLSVQHAVGYRSKYEFGQLRHCPWSNNVIKLISVVVVMYIMCNKCLFLSDVWDAKC